jgi:hypothetical protein
MSLLKQCLAMLIFASPLLSCGCSGGGGNAPSNIVKGKVTLNGQPVLGEVVFIAADKKETKASIALNGEYSFPNPPKGEYQVLVKSIGMTGTVPGGQKNAMSDPSSSGAGTLKGQEPPKKYAQPDNGLPKLNVTGGEQKFDIELTP